MLINKLAMTCYSRIFTYLADHPKAGALQELRLAARVSTLNQRALNVLAFPIEADHIAELSDKS